MYNCYRTYTLCSDPEDNTASLRLYYYQLRARGYSEKILLPLFERGYQTAIEKENNPTIIPPTDDEEDLALLRSRIFYHNNFHPNNPPSSTLQQTWIDNILSPSDSPHITTLKNNTGGKIRLKQMTVAYSRPPNLGNLLSSRNLHLTTGLPVSSYRK